MQSPYVSQVPIPTPTEAQREAIETLVRQLLDVEGEGPQVEGILGRPLPVGAWHYRTWWAFPGGARVPAQVQAWRMAGWRVYLVDQHAGWVWFKRKHAETER
jgi:hypothetical protein